MVPEVSELDDKLRELVQPWAAEMTNDLIAQIKQAYSEAGYIDLHEHYDKSKTNVFRMTSQEWYERFGQEAQYWLLGAPSSDRDSVMEAAKRAAGLEN